MFFSPTNRLRTTLVLVLASIILGLAAAPAPRHFAQKEEAMTESTPYLSNLLIASSSLGEDFVPDGNVDKPAWKSAPWQQMEHDVTGRKILPQATTDIATLWTPANLYVAFRCHYSTLNIYEGEDAAKERWELWDRDVVEIFVNPQPERVPHYYEFEVAPNNQWIDLEIDKTKTPFNDAGWNSGFLHATRVNPESHTWTCEMRIPAGSMGAENISPGEEWRINFYRADGPGDDTARRFLSWSPIPEGGSFHVPTRFGIIRFKK
jgi:Carbohydrate family 9 binding domain-like